MRLKFILLCFALFFLAGAVSDVSAFTPVDQCSAGEGSNCWVADSSSGSQSFLQGICDSVGACCVSGGECYTESESGYCGDGLWDESRGEQCDDGNNVDGDGCDRSCNLEPGCYNADISTWSNISYGCPGNLEIINSQSYNLSMGLCNEFSSFGVSYGREIVGDFDISVDFNSTYVGPEEPTRPTRPLVLSFAGISNDGRRQQARLTISQDSFAGEDAGRDISAIYFKDVDSWEQAHFDGTDPSAYVVRVDEPFPGDAGQLRIKRTISGDGRSALYEFYYYDDANPSGRVLFRVTEKLVGPVSLSILTTRPRTGEDWTTYYPGSDPDRIAPATSAVFDFNLSSGNVYCDLCGNGERNVGEQCDDGNTAEGDGCSSICEIEDGWQCIGEFGEISQCIDDSLCTEPEPVANWKFDEDSWTVGVSGMVKDSSLNGINGTAGGNANTVADGKLGRAGSFDGTGDYVSFTSSSLINLRNVYTRSISVWFKASDVQPRQVLYKEGGVSNGFNIYLDSGSLYAGFWGNGFDNAWMSVPFSDTTAWNHVVLTFDDNNDIQKMYLNGVEVASSSKPGYIPTHSGSITAAYSNQELQYHDGGSNSANYYKGLLDDISIWNKALSQQEVEGLYNSGNGKTACGTDTGTGGGGSQTPDEYWSDDGINEISYAHLNDNVKLVAKTDFGGGVTIQFNVLESDAGGSTDIRTFSAVTTGDGVAVVDWQISSADMQSAGAGSGDEGDNAEFYFTTSSDSNPDYSGVSRTLYVANIPNGEINPLESCSDYNRFGSGYVCENDPDGVAEEHEGYDSSCNEVDPTSGCYIGCGCEWIDTDGTGGGDSCSFVKSYEEPPQGSGGSCTVKTCSYNKEIVQSCEGDSEFLIWIEDGKLLDGNQWIDDPQCPDIEHPPVDCSFELIKLPFFNTLNLLVAIAAVAFVYYLALKMGLFGRKRSEVKKKFKRRKKKRK